MRHLNQREHFSNGPALLVFFTDVRYERQVHDIHIAAFYLDPVNRTIPLDDHSNQRILKFFQQCARSEEEANVMHTHFALWREQLTPFEKGAFCWKFADKGAREFWVSTINRTKALGILCNRLFSTPANSVPSERSFSTQNYLHTKTRNSLRSDRVDKLTYIYMNSRVFDERTEGDQDILTAEEEEQLDEDMDIEDVEFEELEDEDVEFEE